MSEDPLLLSVGVALAATLLDLLVGAGLAWALAYGRFRGRTLLDVAVSAPLALPPTVVGYYLLILLGRGGPVGRLASALGLGPLLFTPAAAVAASSVVALPLVVHAIRLGLQAIPPELVEAAHVDGAGRLQAVRHVIVPLALPGVGSGAALGFARALGEFGATLMVAGNIPGRTQTVSTAIFTAVQAGQMEQAHRYSLLLLGVAALSVWAWRRLGGRHEGAAEAVRRLR